MDQLGKLKFNRLFDLIIIGAGPGGYVAAIRAAQLGLKVCVIEKRKELGGTCLNVGCIPSKALLHSSHLYQTLLQHGKENGIKALPSIDFPQMMRRKESIVSSFASGIEALFKKNKIERLHGTARLTSPTEVQVEGKSLQAPSILLATGSEPVPIGSLPFDQKSILSSTEALCLSQIPKRLAVVGAGVIGLELGSVYARLGSEVQVFEFADRICPAFDNTLTKALQKSLQEQGLKIYLSHKVLKEAGGVLFVEGPEGAATHPAEKILVAVGRRPYTEGLGLEALGVAKDPKGFLLVDASFRTSVPSLFAIGDLIDGPMLAHKAEEEGIAVAELLAGRSPTVNYLAIPSVIYTHPELSSVGLTEEQCKEKKIGYKAVTFPFKANSRARCTDEQEGIVKLIGDLSDQRLLGVHILGAHASELIAEGALAIRKELSVSALAHTCYPHPTLSEALKEAALAFLEAPIHL